MADPGPHQHKSGEDACDVGEDVGHAIHHAITRNGTHQKKLTAMPARGPSFMLPPSSELAPVESLDAGAQASPPRAPFHTASPQAVSGHLRGSARSGRAAGTSRPYMRSWLFSRALGAKSGTPALALGKGQAFASLFPALEGMRPATPC